MPWQYQQSNGTLTHNGIYVDKGYSGKGIGKNTPDMENVKNVGPIPRGSWSIGQPRDSGRRGPHVLDLSPQAHSAHGRTEFLIHGDSIGNPGFASEGCIIFNRKTRERISNSGDNVLRVVR